MKPEPRHVPGPAQVLASWKEIANYLRRDVRTVQRWETTRGLPVHRLPGRGKNAVYAVPSELERWWAGSPARQEAPEVVTLPGKAVSLRWWWAAGGAVVVAAAALWLVFREPAAPLQIPQTPLTSLPGAEFHPAISPDGRRLAFAWIPEGSRDYDLYVMDLPSGKPRQLTKGPQLDWFPEWAPDGRRIAYVRLAVGAEEGELRLLDADTGDDRLLFVSPVAAVEPPPWALAWTADGKALILTDYARPGGPYGLTRYDIATGVSTALTVPPQGVVGDSRPTLSPDGRALLFLRLTTAESGNLFRLDLSPEGGSAGEPVQITHEPCCVDSGTWTRNGREIVFVSRRASLPQLMRVDAYGGTARRDLSVAQPGWAPRVAANGWLVTSDARSVTRILEVDLKTGQSAPVIRSSREDAAPALSPDGRRIAFASDRSGSRQIWVGESDGSGARQVTHLEGVTAFTPRWAPDGRRIAFEGRRGPASRIYLVSPDAGTAVALETGGSLHRLPSWSRDGRRVYFGSDRSGRFEVWKTRVGDAGQALETTQVTRSGGVAGFESADGKYFYYSKGETMTSIWQVPVAGGQEKPVLEEFAFNRYAANLAASRSGLYFPGRAQKDGCPIWELPFSPGKPREVYRMHGWLSPLGIAVSEDDRRLLVTVFTHQSGDILAYQAFR